MRLRLTVPSWELDLSVAREEDEQAATEERGPGIASADLTIAAPYGPYTPQDQPIYDDRLGFHGLRDVGATSAD